MFISSNKSVNEQMNKNGSTASAAYSSYDIAFVSEEGHPHTVIVTFQKPV